MDRTITYPGAIPEETDILSGNRYAMVGLGMLTLDLLGSSTAVTGLACTPTTPAGLNILIAAGRLYSLQNVDNTAYSSLAADTAHQILKQGILPDPVQLACPAPGTFGFSTNYLIQAAYQDSDTGLTTLPYYNAANPDQPFSGPENSGVAQATARQGIVSVTVKAGTSATTGTQTTPSPDVGNVGLYVVTVANGQTAINAGNISTLLTAPFLTPLLTQLQAQRIRLTANTTFFVSPTGNDANNGLTVSTPWATVQRAVTVLQKNYDLNGFTATILRANGTYNESVTINGPLVGQFGPGGLVISASASGNCTVNATSSGPCYYALNGAMVTIQNQTLVATLGIGIAILAQLAASVVHTACNFGAAAAAHCNAGFAASIQAGGNYTISGSAPTHQVATSGGSISVNSVTVTLAGTPAFTQFANAQHTGTVGSAGVTFSGSATGSRYSALTNGVINTSGSGANYFPGNSAGTTSTGGQYV